MTFEFCGRRAIQNKMVDQFSDAILDALLEQDKGCRVGG
jgi:S-adenosylmethionine synthetase